MTRIRGGSLVALTVAVLGAWLLQARPAAAYERWSGCETCHGGFRTNPYVSLRGTTWPDSLHNVHRNAAPYMNTGCDVCHETGTRVDPPIGVSIADAFGATPGPGCLGCHGQPDATGASQGYGLRLHHVNAGVASCAGGCHAGDPAPPAESVQPHNYGGTDTSVDESCNPATAYLEDWSGDDEGLDNDGDTLYDGADPDCSAACTDADSDGYSPDGGSCGAVDCNDAEGAVHPGATEACNGVDDNCDGTTDEGCAADADADGDADGDVPTDEGPDADADGDVPTDEGPDADADGDVPTDEGPDADADGDVPTEGGADADADADADARDIVGDTTGDTGGDGGPPPSGGDEGCGCSVTGGEGAFSTALLAFVALVLGSRRRRRS